MQVRDDVILGLDIGVGSLGWALLEEDLQTGEQRLLQRHQQNNLPHPGGCTHRAAAFFGDTATPDSGSTRMNGTPTL